MKTNILIVIVAAVLLSLVSPAQAIYIETPLNLSPGDSRADAGEQIEFIIQPNPDSDNAKGDWAGKNTKLRYAYDKNEHQEHDDPDRATSNDGHVEKSIADVVLDENAKGRFTWTIPAEVDGHNLYLHLVSADGELLAFAYLAVGDAPEQYRIMSGPDGEPEHRIDVDESEESTSSNGAAEAAGIAMIGLLAALGLVAVIAGNRRR
jgi:hypothetical protein